MKIDSVKQNYNSGSRIQKKVSVPQSFTGMNAVGKEIMKTLYHRKSIERMSSLEWLKGEIGGILLTALGTGAVAPIFIGFNPFVKAPKNATPEQKEETKNTKLYTAMRQPISAGLAILFQASVQKYIDKGLDKVFHDKRMASLAGVTHDLQEFESKYVIENKVKKNLANMEKPSLIKSWFSKSAKEKRNAYKEAFDAGVDAENNKTIEKLTKHLQETGKIKVGERNLDSEMFSQVINNKINEYIKDAKELRKTEPQIAFYVDRAKVLYNNEDYLREIFKDIPFEQTYQTTDEKVLKPLYKQTGEIIDRLWKNEPEGSPVKTILKEIKDLPEDLRADKVKRTLQRIDKIKEMCGEKGFTTDNYEKALIKRNDILGAKIVKLLRAQVKDSSILEDKDNVKGVIRKIAEICGVGDGKVVQDILRDTSTFGKKVDDLEKNIYKDIIKGYKDLIDKHALSFSQYTKIAVGVLITLPITCTALNWVYPRFMETFFPKLAGVKKDHPQASNPQARAVQMTGGDK